MEAVFIKLLNMSIAAGWLILAVVFLRAVLKRAPKSIRRILWALVTIRLVLPYSPESFLSLIPSAETVSPDILYAETPEIHSGIYALNTFVNPAISEILAPAADAGIAPAHMIASAASVVWMIGMAALILYGAVSFVRLRRRVADAVIMRDNLWQSEKVTSPFVLGLFRPRIYLPPGMDEESMAYVVAHERTHISLCDHWIKPLGFLILTVYWFNPLVWLAYILLCRDIELACDERVVKQMSTDEKKAYSKALLACSVDRRTTAACPLAFGEVGVKQRIKNVLHYKKPAFRIIIAALASCVIVALCFLTNPKKTVPEPFGRSFRVDAVVYNDLRFSFTYTPDTAPRYRITDDHVLMKKEAGDIVWMSLGHLREDHLSPLVFDDYFGAENNGAGRLQTPYGPDKLRLDNKAAWSLTAGDTFYYVLLQNNGDVYLALGYHYPDAKYPDSQGFIRWLFKLRDTGLEDLSEIPAFSEATAYVSRSCVYMNPLSSMLSNGDSGCRYLIGESIFAIINRKTGEIIAVSSPVGWDWQKISPEEWSALFLTGFGTPDIGGYENPQVLKFSSRYYLFDMDGELWIGEYHGEKVGMWCIYSLIPESSAPPREE